MAPEPTSSDPPSEPQVDPEPPAPPASRRWLRHTAIAVGAVLLLSCLLWRPVFRALPGLLIERQAPKRADAIVVLAGDHLGGRVDHAVTLFQAGHVPAGPFVLSGGTLYGELSWARAMAERAAGKGVPRARLLTQDRSTTTVEDARFTLPMLELRNVKTVLLVTSAWHSNRAAEVFRAEAGERIEVVVCPAPDPPAEWWSDAGATRALVTELLKYFWPGPGG